MDYSFPVKSNDVKENLDFKSFLFFKNNLNINFTDNLSNIKEKAQSCIKDSKDSTEGIKVFTY